MPHDARYWIEQLQMQAHPEGGYYKETYRSEGIIDSLQRHVSTAIYFLLSAGEFSAFHRIKSDEMWHFYAGSPLDIYVINQQGHLEILQLGANVAQGESFQQVVPAGCWFASRLHASHDQSSATQEAYALVGCTVAPGFDFRDFEMAERGQLTQLYPQHAAIIRQLTRDES